jgi:glycosyltransferase involved in cell wall biosynthesis
MQFTPKVSFVIIGHNEEENIEACIQSILDADYPDDKKEIIYVDNYSQDASIAKASRFPIRILALKKDPPHPGIARNAGLAAATGEFVQFVDGDMELDPNWLRHAIPHFERSNLGCVVGRMIEQRPEATPYNAILNFSWKLKELGSVESPSGGGLFRREAVAAAGGYDETMRAGEEIDLGYKLRRAGYEIYSIEPTMVKHDADLRSLRQFLRRSFRDGYGEMQVILKHFRRGESWPQHDTWKMNTQVGSFILLTGILVMTQEWLWIPLTLSAPLMLVARKTLRCGRQTGLWRASFLYSFFLYFCMIPQVIGEVRCLWDHLACRGEIALSQKRALNIMKQLQQIKV